MEQKVWDSPRPKSPELTRKDTGRWLRAGEAKGAAREADVPVEVLASQLCHIEPDVQPSCAALRARAPGLILNPRARTAAGHR